MNRNGSRCIDVSYLNYTNNIQKRVVNNFIDIDILFKWRDGVSS